MPSEEPQQYCGYNHVKSGVEWREATLGEKRQSDNLESVRSDGY